MSKYQKTNSGYFSNADASQLAARSVTLRPGDKVEPYLVDHSFAYRPTKASKREISSEFDHWLNQTAKKYAPALKKLATG
ncbi:MAG: hypothetical protein M1484_02370 [Patescibacteria group bacterium]|nr:hypothetical protein [Patescibacteria group bacterium]